MFEVAPGTEAKVMERRQAARIAALRMGTASEVQYLSGGSATRREAAEDIIATFAAAGIKAYRVGGYSIRIGNTP